jgi:hypothetical protein
MTDQTINLAYAQPATEPRRSRLALVALILSLYSVAAVGFLMVCPSTLFPSRMAAELLGLSILPCWFFGLCIGVRAALKTGIPFGLPEIALLIGTLLPLLFLALVLLGILN